MVRLGSLLHEVLTLRETRRAGSGAMTGVVHPLVVDVDLTRTSLTSLALASGLLAGSDATTREAGLRRVEVGATTELGHVGGAEAARRLHGTQRSGLVLHALTLLLATDELTLAATHNHHVLLTLRRGGGLDVAVGERLTLVAHEAEDLDAAVAGHQRRFGGVDVAGLALARRAEREARLGVQGVRALAGVEVRASSRTTSEGTVTTGTRRHANDGDVDLDAVGVLDVLEVGGVVAGMTHEVELRGVGGNPPFTRFLRPEGTEFGVPGEHGVDHTVTRSRVARRKDVNESEATVVQVVNRVPPSRESEGRRGERRSLLGGQYRLPHVTSGALCQGYSVDELRNKEPANSECYDPNPEAVSGRGRGDSPAAQLPGSRGKCSGYRENHSRLDVHHAGTGTAHACRHRVPRLRGDELVP